MFWSLWVIDVSSSLSYRHSGAPRTHFFLPWLRTRQPGLWPWYPIFNVSLTCKTLFELAMNILWRLAESNCWTLILKLTPNWYICSLEEYVLIYILVHHPFSMLSKGFHQSWKQQPMSFLKKILKAFTFTLNAVDILNSLIIRNMYLRSVHIYLSMKYFYPSNLFPALRTLHLLVFNHLSLIISIV